MARGSSVRLKGRGVGVAVGLGVSVGGSGVDVGDGVGVSVGTVERDWRLARAKLRSYLTDALE